MLNFKWKWEIMEAFDKVEKKNPINNDALMHAGKQKRSRTDILMLLTYCRWLKILKLIQTLPT